MQKHMIEYFSRSAKLFSVAVSPQLDTDPRIMFGIERELMGLNLKADFINDENGIAVKEADGTYTLVVGSKKNVPAVRSFLEKKYKAAFVKEVKLQLA
jgi:hypothetical protein